MRYHLLATDYDGTLATDGKVTAETVAALRAVLATGRRLVLVTGRDSDELMSVHPDLTIFERVVAENGALLYRPATKERRRLAEPPPPAIPRRAAPARRRPALRRRGHRRDARAARNSRARHDSRARPRAAGHLQQRRRHGVAGRREQSHRAHGRARGAQDLAAQRRRRRRRRERPLVPEALRAIRGRRRRVARDPRHGRSQLCAAKPAPASRELAAELVATRPRRRRARPISQRLTFGVDERGMPVTLEPYGDCILVCGASASGKSTVARRVVESLQRAVVPVLRHRSRRRLRGTTGRRRHRQTRRRAAPRRGRAAARGLRRQRRRLHDRRADLRPAARTSRRCCRISCSCAGATGARTGSSSTRRTTCSRPSGRFRTRLLPETLVNVLLVTVHPELLSAEMQKRVTQLVAVGPTAPRAAAAIRRAARACG